MTLSLYIARRFVVSVLAIFFGVLCLAALFDTIELARRAGGNADVGFGSLIALASLRAPSISIKAAPFVMLLAAMWTYARMARSSELVITRAAGVSVWGVTAPTLIAAGLLGAVATTAYNPVAAALLDKFERWEAQLFRDDNRLLSVSGEGLWLRQGNRESQSVIHALDTNSDGTRLEDVTIYLFEGEDEYVGRIDAKKATLNPGFWRLDDAMLRITNRDDPKSAPQQTAAATYDMPTELTADQILESFAPPETIPFWRLPHFIATLERQGFSARRHTLYMHASLAAPLVFAAMAMLGSAFSMRHARLGGLGTMALYASLTGFAVYFVFDIAQALAGSGAIPPIPAAWGPPAASLMLAAGLLLHFEDG